MHKERIVFIDGESFLVPRHINRVHSKDDTTMGWQVRFCRVTEGYYSKYFPDLSNGGPDKSLEAASRHLDSLSAFFSDNDKLITTRVGGTPSLAWSFRHRTTLQAAICVRLATRKPDLNGSRYKMAGFYVGTVKTISQESIDKGLAYCYAAHKWATDFIAQHGREALFNYDGVPEYSEVMRYDDESKKEGLVISLEEALLRAEDLRQRRRNEILYPEEMGRRPVVAPR